MVQSLGRAILSGRYAPGEVLDGEVAGALAYGVSRGAYREAVRMLVAKGLVASRPRHGTTVLPRRCWNMIDTEVLAWGLIDDPDPRLARSIVELSSIIEPAAAAVAARRRSQDDMDALQGTLGEIRQSRVGTVQRGGATRALHGHILLASRSPALVAMGPAISAAADQRLLLAESGLTLPRDELPIYAALVDAIGVGDPGRAEMEMRQLVAEAAVVSHGTEMARVERASAQGDFS